jgi:phosphate transport system permease protein
MTVAEPTRDTTTQTETLTSNAAMREFEAEVTTAPRTKLGTAPTVAVPVTSRRKLGGLSRGQVLDIVGAALGGLSISILLFGHFAPLSGPFGFVLVSYVSFMGLYATLTSISESGPAVKDRIFTVLLYSAALVLLFALILVVTFTLWRGHTAFFHTNFFTQDMSEAGPLSPLTVGGIKHALIGTLWMITIALIITVPLGITCAIYLTQVGGRGSKFIRTMVEAMTALPSIVAGLFIFATWILILGNSRSGLAAALALSVMMLPIIIRSADVVLRLVPGNLKEASEALGAPRWKTVWHVVLPTARSGLATAVILGTARGIGETSPVLLTAGYNVFMNTNPTHGPMVSLPLAVFELVRSPQPAYVARGFATAALLMMLVLVLFVIARLIGGRGPGQLSGGQRRRIERQSKHDLERIEGRAHTPTPVTSSAGANA